MLAARWSRARSAGSSPQGGGLRGPEATCWLGCVPAIPRCQTGGQVAVACCCCQGCCPQVRTIHEHGACMISSRCSSPENQGLACLLEMAPAVCLGCCMPPLASARLFGVVGLIDTYMGWHFRLMLLLLTSERQRCSLRLQGNPLVYSLVLYCSPQACSTPGLLQSVRARCLLISPLLTQVLTLVCDVSQMWGAGAATGRCRA